MLSMKRVVIIGAGYSGVKALRELVDREDIQITILDKHPYHNLQPEVYDFIANKSDSADVTIDLISLFRAYGNRVKFLNYRVESVDFKAQKIKCENKELIDYDYLVVATGSRTGFPSSIEGLTNTDDIKKLHKALKFKQRFEEEIFKKMDNEGRKCEETHIVIVGAGLSGVEIAAEMAYYSNKFFKKGFFACDNLKISLISSSESVLPRQDKYLVNKSSARLRDLGVEIIANKRVKSVDREFVYLNDGSKIRYSFTIYAGGVEASQLAMRLNLERNVRGQILVDEFCRVKGFENIFAAGDVAEIFESEDKIAPPSVPTAEQSAKVVAKNIKNSIDAKELSKCKINHPGVLVALGGRYAVAKVGKSFYCSGFLAYIIKQVAFFKYRFPLSLISKRGYKK